jgi:hypothetical protein
MHMRRQTVILVVVLLFTSGSVAPPARASGRYHTVTTYYTGECDPAGWTAVGTREEFCTGSPQTSGTQGGDWQVQDWESCNVPYDTGQDVFEYCQGQWIQYYGVCQCHSVIQ